MNEEEFDRTTRFRPFQREDVMRLANESRRNTSLAFGLWGRTAERLQQQLLAPHPEIPAGFDLQDLRSLQRYVQTILIRMKDPRYAWVGRFFTVSSPIVVGARTFTEWAARYEIVRRAIAYLENR